MLPDETSPAGLTLRVQDADRLATFYRDQLGFESLERAGNRHRLTLPGGRLRLVLEEAPDAPPRPPRSTGLFHFAILFPDRRSLAATLTGLLDRGVEFSGFSDHGVSEAAYLSDPEGNGIELYRDRPEDQWPRSGDEVAMVTKPLDLEDLLDEAEAPAGPPQGTRLGHVHLHVADLGQAGRFFEQVGFAPTQTSYPGALFLAAGGYHHHVGLNRWAGDAAPPEGATGLVQVDWDLPADALADQRARWEDAGLEVETGGDGVDVVDPVGIVHRFAEREP